MLVAVLKIAEICSLVSRITPLAQRRLMYRLSAAFPAEAILVQADPLDTAIKSLVATISASESRPGRDRLST